MKVLITGATGFIGSHLCQHLLALGHEITAVTRSADSVSTGSIPGSQTIVVADITAINPSHLTGIDVVIHLAGVAHDYGIDQSEFERVNVEGTRHLAKCCIEASVGKLVFLSSVKAIAENSESPLGIDVHPAPRDDYGKSKLAAENLLQELSSAQSSSTQSSSAQSSTTKLPGREFSRMETLIVRIPLVYGEGVKGNFQSLVKLVRSGFPLVFGAIQNKRSYLGIQNLCDFLANCVQQDVSRQHLRTGIVHIADEASVSLATLVESIAFAMGKARKNYWIPKFLIVLVASILYGRNRAVSLFGDLELHMADTFQKTAWRPPYDLQRGLDAMLQPPGQGEESWYGKLSRKPD